MKEVTTIVLKKKTKERLRKLGEKGQSYDYILNKLLDELGKK